MSRGLWGRLERLEAQAGPEVEGWPDWDPDDQADAVLHKLKIHRAGGYAGQFTDREIAVLGGIFAGGGASLGEAASVPGRLPEGVRGYVERMDPGRQEAHERKLYVGHEEAKERRDYWRDFYSPEQVRAREDEQKRRDRELLERNRASVG